MSSLGAPEQDFMECRTQESGMRKTALLGTAVLVALSAAVTTLAVVLPTNVQASLPTPFNLRNDPGIASVKLADGRVLDLVGSEGDLVLSDRQTFRLSSPRRFASLTVMPTGQVLIWGGIDNEGRLIETGEWFEPSTGALLTTGRLGLPVRAGHTLNVLSDGTLAMTGGWGQGNVPAYEVALWRPLDRHLDLVAGDAGHARLNARASLLADGTLQIHGGVDEVGRPVHDDWRFGAADGQPVKPHGIAASYPARDKNAASPMGPLALRFADPVDVNQLNGTVSLLGPNGVVKTHVVGAEGGRLAFVQLPDELYPAARYTIFVQGLHTASGDAVPYEAIGFTTKAARSGVVLAGEGKRPGVPTSEASGEPPVYVMAGAGKVTPCKPVDAFHLCRSKGEVKDGAFYPGQDNVATASGGHWRLYADRQTSPDTRERESNLPKGNTALIGQVRRIDESPVANVEITVAGQHVRTDAQGVFVLRDLLPGRKELFVDGGPAGNASTEYGRFIVGADVAASTVNHMPYVMYLPRVLARDKIALPSPTTHETVLTHPDMPGLELRIPAGAVFKDRNGKVLTEIAIVPTPVDHAPFPLPDNFPTYFTIQPGDAVVQGMTPEAAKGIQVVYPNYGKAPAAHSADFWVYNPQSGWQMYGAGQVTADSRQIAPNPGTSLVWALGAGGSLNNAADFNSSQACNKTVVQPVDVESGIFFHEWDDLQISDTIPIGVHRTHNGLGNGSSMFGWGSGSDAGMTLSSANGFENPYLVLPCGEPIRFHLVAGVAQWPLVGTVWQHTETDSAFYGSTLEFLYDSTPAQAHWVLTTKTGTRYSFDRHAPNRLEAVSDRFGNTVQYTYNSGLLQQVVSPHGRSLTYQFNNRNYVSSVTDNAGRTVSYDYHYFNYWKNNVSGGVLTKVTYPDQTSEEYTYATIHRGDANVESWYMETMKDRRGNVWVKNTYDESDTPRVLKQTFADGSFYSFEYRIDASAVKSTLVTDASGNKQLYEFDPSSRYLQRVTLGYGTPLAQVTSYVRSAGGLVLSEIDALGRKTETQRDAMGNPLVVTRLAGTDGATTSRYTYTPDDSQLVADTDPLGRTTVRSYTNGCLTSVTDAMGHLTSFSCNGSGLRTSATDSLGNTTAFGYRGGDLIEVIDPLKRKKTFVYDVLGRSVSKAEPDGTLTLAEYDLNDRIVRTTDALSGITEYSFDQNGNPSMVRMPNASKISYTYDAMNRLRERTDALGRIERWTYDALGHVLSATDRKGQVTTFSYDVLSRPVLTTYADGSGIETTYDVASRRIGLLDSLAGAIDWTYDDLDRLTSEVSPQGTIQYAYDRVGQRRSMTAGDQAVTSYTYDDVGNLTLISRGDQMVRFQFDDAGQRTSTILPNGIEATYKYDVAGQLVRLDYMDRSGVSVFDASYAYDESGHRTRADTVSTTEPLPPASSHDGIFDAANRITSFEGRNIQYDQNGNVINDGNRDFVWNARNQLVSIKGGGVDILTFSYDALGRRISKKGASKKSYLYDGLNSVDEFIEGVHHPIMTGLNVDERYAREGSGGHEYFLVDALRSTVALTDDDGAVSRRYQYDAYGRMAIGSVSPSEFENDVLYTGRERDGDDLYYYRARYYSPAMGRFLSEDPLQFNGGSVNFYGYVGGNPISFVDPLGLCGASPDDRGVGTAACDRIHGGAACEKAVEKFCDFGPQHRTCCELQRLACQDGNEEDYDKMMQCQAEALQCGLSKPKEIPGPPNDFPKKGKLW
jgi:RHS repeat-associated protein